MKPIVKRNLKRWGMLLIIDILLIGSWIVHKGSGESDILMIPFYLGTAFFINIVATVAFYFIKKEYMYLLFINAFISPIFLLFFWHWNIEIQRYIFTESWTFKVDNMPYEITYHDFGSNESSTYQVFFHLNKYSSNGDDRGTVFRSNDTIFFHSERDSTMVYYIYKNELYNFKPYYSNERETCKRIRIDKNY
jgi:uncharacterized membrane-anchored protein YitT (DUF2179 family)